MIPHSPEVAAVVPAAGRGDRLGTGRNKLAIPIAGEPILVRALRPLEACPLVGEIVVVVSPQGEPCIPDLEKWGMRKARILPVGGEERWQSVYNGLVRVSPRFDFVLIHDGARPFLSLDLLNRCVQEAFVHDAAVAAIPVTDTIKRTDASGLVVETLDRSQLWQVQTPQVFRKELILAAYRGASEAAHQDPATDDAILVERLGTRVKLVMGDPFNIKVTRQVDLMFAQALASHWKGGWETAGEDAAGTQLSPSAAVQASPRGADFRSGFGYDVHPLAKGRPLVLGGVKIDHPLGLAGHSDADVVAHAICDALLGAAALGDIGQNFPEDDEEYRDISSLILLRRVSEMLAAAGYQVANIDVTVVAQEPKLAPYRLRMVENLSRAAALPSRCISVKATTTEKLGFVGRGEGIACYATALIYRKNL